MEVWTLRIYSATCDFFQVSTIWHYCDLKILQYCSLAKFDLPYLRCIRKSHFFGVAVAITASWMAAYSPHTLFKRLTVSHKVAKSHSVDASKPARRNKHLSLTSWTWPNKQNIVFFSFRGGGNCRHDEFDMFDNAHILQNIHGMKSHSNVHHCTISIKPPVPPTTKHIHIFPYPISLRLTHIHTRTHAYSHAHTKSCMDTCAANIWKLMQICDRNVYKANKNFFEVDKSRKSSRVH